MEAGAIHPAQLKLRSYRRRLQLNQTFRTLISTEEILWDSVPTCLPVCLSLLGSDSFPVRGFSHGLSRLLVDLFPWGKFTLNYSDFSISFPSVCRMFPPSFLTVKDIRIFSFLLSEAKVLFSDYSPFCYCLTNCHGSVHLVSLRSTSEMYRFIEQTIKRPRA